MLHKYSVTALRPQLLGRIVEDPLPRSRPKEEGKEHTASNSSSSPGQWHYGLTALGNGAPVRVTLQTSVCCIKWLPLRPS